MTILYRNVDPKNFEECLEFLLGYEFSWRDADPEEYIPHSDTQRDENARKLMQNLVDGTKTYHCLAVNRVFQ